MRRSINPDVLVTTWSPELNDKPKEKLTTISLTHPEAVCFDFATWLSKCMQRMKMTPPELTKKISSGRATVYLWLSGRTIAQDAIYQSRLSQIISERLSLSYRDVLRELLWRCHISECRRLL